MNLRLAAHALATFADHRPDAACLRALAEILKHPST